jgi:ribonuclease HI
VHFIICDGGHRSSITYGSFKLFDDTGTVLKHKQLVFGYGTSNLAEYLILIQSLKYAIMQGIDDIVVLTDSKLVKNQILGRWECNYDHLRVARDSARDLLDKFNSWKIKKVTRNTVKHHLGH